MIDTIKIYCEVSKDISQQIKSKSIVNSSMDYSTGELQYEITNGHLTGSYDSRLSVRTDCGLKYGFVSLSGGYYVSIEGSYHKIKLGYNSHNGFYDFQEICFNLIKQVEDFYNINLPNLSQWYLQRVDIAICYDLKNQDNVKSYINSLSRCNYPRRKVKFFYDESIYLSGSTTTLKIYNKYLEFKKHDLKKFINTDFNLISYLTEIQGFIRFECEIKNRILKTLVNKKDVFVCDVNYEMLKKVWSDEFMKLLKFVDNQLTIVRGREDVKDRLLEYLKPNKAMRLYAFYCSIQLNGLEDVKKDFSRCTYYRNIKDLQDLAIDFSQCYKIEKTENIFWFNPFEYEEVL